MSDRYRPLFKLDSGGMAEVYVAEAESMAGFKKKVAIKRVLPKLLKDERFIRMFLDEARLALHLSHANIVSVFDIGKSSSTYFIVMEYVAGTNLKQLMVSQSRRNRLLPPHITVWLVNEILKGLGYAHSFRDPETGKLLGIVHRDISPPNILISWNGEVKLTDFGLAKASTQLESTDPGVVKGKFAYLSPEAAHGLEIDRRTDIFAVGIIAFEMLTGRRLFLGQTDYQTVELVRNAEIPAMRELNPAIPAELEAIILKALARDPNERFQQAADFSEELLGFLFSHSLKVSSRDLARALAEMRDAEPQVVEPRIDPSASNLIMQLIEEEFVNFRSLDDSGETSEGGSRPLLDLGTAYDPASPLPLSDFESNESSPLPSNDTTPAPGAAHPMAAGARKGSPAPKKESGGAWTFVLLLLLFAAVGGGAYYWLIMLGNLERFM